MFPTILSRANPLKKMIADNAMLNFNSLDQLHETFLTPRREIIDNAFDAIFVHTLDGKLLEVNEAACRRLGYDRNELVNKEREELVALNLIGSMPEYIEIIDRDTQLIFESVSITASGELIPVEVRARKIKYQGDDAILTFSRDLTEQKARENAVREKLEALQRHAVHISRLYSIENVAEYSFEIIEELLGAVKGAIGVVEGNHLKFVFIHNLGPETIPPLPLEGRGITTRAVRTGETQVVGDTRMDPDYIEDLKGPSLLSELDVPIQIDGKVVAVINLQVEKANFFTDEDKKIVEILSEHISSAMARGELLKNVKKAEEKWHQLLESSLDSVIVLSGTIITYVNTNTALLLGYSSSSELIGKDVTQIISKEEQGCLKLVQDETQVEKRTNTFEINLLSRIGQSIPVEIKVNAIEFEEKPAAVAFARDISKRKKYEQQILSLHHHAVVIQKARNETEIVNATLDTVEEILGCHLISYLQMTEKGLLAVGNRGSPTLGIPLPLDGKGITVKAAREKKTILVEDTRKSPDFFRGTSDSLSELSVPVNVNDKIIGVINLEEKRLDAFTDTDVKIVETLALHVASSIERITSEKSI
jgi:PAS domain S-box-containing protein